MADLATNSLQFFVKSRDASHVHEAAQTSATQDSAAYQKGSDVIHRLKLMEQNAELAAALRLVKGCGQAVQLNVEATAKSATRPSFTNGMFARGVAPEQQATAEAHTTPSIAPAA